MVFNRRVSGSCVGRPDLATTYIAATVMPMGWLLAVAAMQHVGHRLALCPPPLGAGLDLPDLRGDPAFPIETPWGSRAWQEIYLDNWDATLVWPAALVHEVLRQPSLPNLCCIRVGGSQMWFAMLRSQWLVNLWPLIRRQIRG